MVHYWVGKYWRWNKSKNRLSLNSAVFPSHTGSMWWPLTIRGNIPFTDYLSPNEYIPFLIWVYITAQLSIWDTDSISSIGQLSRWNIVWEKQQRVQTQTYCSPVSIGKTNAPSEPKFRGSNLHWEIVMWSPMKQITQSIAVFVQQLQVIRPHINWHIHKKFDLYDT